MEACVYVLLSLCLGRVAASGGSTAPAVNTCAAQCHQVSPPCTCYTDGWIDCRAQGIANVPTNLPNCSRLLALNNNKITEIGVLDFLGLENVLEVKLEYNQLTRVEAGTFSDLAKLRKLSLNNNLIEFVADCAFHGLPSLTDLHLEHNRIRQIGDRAFDSMPCLTSLFIFNNSLTTFEPQWFDNKPNLTSVFDGGNPWHCTCEHKKAHTLLVATHNLNADCFQPFFELAAQFCFRCATPTALLTKSLLTATLAEFTDCPTAAPATTAPADPTTVIAQPTTSQEAPQGNGTAAMPSLDAAAYCSALVQSKIAQATEQRQTTTNVATTTTNGAKDHTDGTVTQDTTTWRESTTDHHITDGSSPSVVPTALPAAGLPAWAIALVVLAVAVMVCLIVAILVLMVYRPSAAPRKDKAASASGTDVKDSGEMETFRTSNPGV